MRKHYILLLLTLLVSASHYSQIGIGTTAPNVSSVLDISSNNKGVLVPRMTSVERDAIVAPATGLLIYNIDTQCNEYYTGQDWYNLCWRSEAIRLSSSNGSAVVEGYDCYGDSSGTLIKAVEPLFVSQTLSANVISKGTYEVKVIVNGVTFYGKGEFSGTGSQSIILNATGIPQEIGTYTYLVNTIPNCEYDRTVFNSESGGTSIIEIKDCSVSRGFLVSNKEATESVEQELTVDVSVAGSYTIKAYNDGVFFIGEGDVEVGIGVKIILKASGTPVKEGMSPFKLNLLPSCSFEREVKGPIVITKQPTAPAPVCSGNGKSVLNVVAKGFGMAYSWRKDGVAVVNGNGISGQGTASLTLTNPEMSLAGNYDVVLIGGDTVTSDSVEVVINLSPTISATTPVERFGKGYISLEAVSSSGNLKWYSVAQGGTSVFDSSPYVVHINKSETFYVEAIETLCTSARKAVEAKASVPSITIQPESSAVLCQGISVLELTVEADGATSYMWRKDEVELKLVSGGVVSGQDTKTLSLTNPLIADSGVYDVVVSNDAGSINSTGSSVIVKPIPTITETKDGFISISTGTAELSATPSAGDVKWYGVEVGGEVLAIGNTFTTPVLTSTKTYYALANDSGCAILARTPIKAVLAKPTITTQPIAPVAVCSGKGTRVLTVTATAVGTITYKWRKDGIDLVNGTVVSGQGTATLTLTNPIATDVGSYDVILSNGEETTSQAVAVVVNPNPELTNKVEKIICDTGSVELSVTFSSGDVTWFSAATNGTNLGVGSTYTTPILTATTSYYVEATDAATGCVSNVRTKITATVSTLPIVTVVATKSRCGVGTVDLVATATDGDVVKWYAPGATVPTDIVSSETFTTPSIEIGSVTYRVSGYNTTTKCESAKKDVVITAIELPTITTDKTVSGCGAGVVKLTATVVSAGNKINWYNSAGDKQELNSGDIYTTAAVAIGETVSYFAEGYNTTTLCKAAKTEVVITGVNLPDITPTPNNVTRCNTGTVELTATPTAADKVWWYNPAAEKLELNTGDKYTTGSIIVSATAVTYKVSAYNTTTKCESAKKDITVFANPLPTVETAISRNGCGNTTTELVAKAIGGDKVRWYDPADIVTEILSEAKYTAAAVAVGSTVTHKVSGYNSTIGCESPKTSVTITGTQMPTVLPAKTSVIACDLQTSELSATLANGGDKVWWYSPTGVKLELGSGDIYTAAVVAVGSSDIYKVSAYNSTTLCESAKIDVTVIGTALPTVTPTTLTASRCDTGIVELTATVAGGGDRVRWYNPTNQIQELLPTDKYSTETIIAGATGVTYNAAAYSTTTGCVSAKTSISVSAVSLPIVTPSNNAFKGCGTGGVAVSATVTSGNKVKWYRDTATVAEGTVDSGIVYTTASITQGQTVTYNVTGFDSSTSCESGKTAVTITVNEKPAVNTTAAINTCGTASVDLIATAIDGDKVRWYSETGTSPLAENISGVAYATGALTTGANIIYKVTALNSTTSCESDKTAITLSGNAMPSIACDTGNRCDTGTVSLVATATNGDKVRWYNSDGTYNQINSGDTFTSGSINIGESLTYNVSAYNSTTLCESPKTVVIAKSNTLPTVNTATAVERCGNGTFALTATASTGGNKVRWYDSVSADPIGEVDSGAIFTSPSVSVGTPVTLKVYGYNSTTTCMSAATSVVLTANILPTVTTAAIVNGCGAGIVKLIAKTTNGDKVFWYDPLDNKQELLSEAEYSTADILVGDSKIYKVTGYNSTTQCESGTKTDITVGANPIPVVTVNPLGALCGTAKVNLTASATDADKIRWYNLTDTNPKGEVNSGSTYTTVAEIVAGSTVTYKVSGYNAITKCESPKSDVVITVNKIPTVDVDGTTTIRCGNGTLNILATVTDGNSLEWYNSAGLLVSTVNSGSTFLTDTVVFGAPKTYSVYGINTSTTCKSVDTVVNAVATVAPTITVASTSVSICGSGTAKLTATVANGADKIKWYDPDGNIQELNPNQEYTTASLAVGDVKVYKVVAYNSTTGCESDPINITVSSKAIPSITNVNANVSRCGTGTIDIIATANNATFKVKWYNSTDVQQGVDLISGATFTTSSIDAGNSAIYKVSAYDPISLCESGKTTVIATAKTLPIVSITNTTEARCGAGTIDLIANASAGATKIKWYNSVGVQQGSILNSGDTFITSPITLGNTDTYKVSAYDPSTTCESVLTTVTVTANLIPTVVPTTTSVSICGSASVSLTATAGNSGTRVRWYDSAGTKLDELDSGTPFSTGLLAIGTSVFSVTGYNSTTKCESAKQDVTVIAKALPSINVSKTAYIRCGDGTIDVLATATGGTQIKWFNSLDVQQGVIVNSPATFTTPNLIVGDTETYKVSAYNSTTLCESDKLSFTVSAIANPTVTVNSTVSRCGIGTVDIIATAGNSAHKIKWYNSSNVQQGSDLASGATFRTSTISAGTSVTYRVSAYDATDLCESAKTDVVVTAKNLPTVTVDSSLSRCESGTINLVATAGGGADKIKWYDSTGVQQGPTLDSGATFTTTNIALGSTIAYSVTSYDSVIGCESAKKAISVTANPLPTVTTATTISVCGTGTVKLTATATGGNKVRWYDTISTTPLGEVNSGIEFFIASVVNGSNSFLVSAYNDVTKCESSPKNSVTVTSTPLPIVTTTEIVYSCGTGNVSLTATASDGGDKLRWYNSLGQFQSETLSDGVFVGYANVGNTAVYFVSAYNSITDCESALKKITITAQVIPTVSAAQTVSRCGTGAADLFATANQADKVRWYDASNSILATVASGTKFRTGILTGVTTFKVSAFNSLGECESVTKLIVTVNLNALPVVSPNTTSISRCDTGTVILVANASNGGDKVRWYDTVNTTPLTEVASGANYTSPSVFVATTVIFKVTAFNSITGCESDKTDVTVTANVLPTVNITDATVSRCGTGSLDLLATTNDADKISWYNSSDVFQAQVNNGLPFTTPSIDAENQAVFKAEANNSTTGCSSSSKISVTAIANPIPTVTSSANMPVCGIDNVNLLATATKADKVRWYNLADGVPIGEVNSNSNFNILVGVGESSVYYVTGFDSVTECESPKIPVNVTSYSLPKVNTNQTVVNCGAGTIELVANATDGGTKVRWYSENSTVPLTEINSGEKYVPNIVAGSTPIFKVSAYNPTTTCESDKMSVTITAATLPTLVISPNLTRCGEGTFDLVGTATNADKVRWYDATSTTLLSIVNSGNKYTTLALPVGTTTFKAEAFNSVGGCKSAMLDVVVTGYAIPVVPTTNITVSRCGAGAVQLTSTVTDGSDKVRWYIGNDATHTSEILPGAVFTTSNLAVNTTPMLYGTTAYNSTTTCESPKITVSVYVNTLPSVSVDKTSASRCGLGKVDFVATASGADQVKWYNSSDVLQGSALASGTVFVTDDISAGSIVVYKVSAYSSISFCESDKTSVTVTANMIPTVSTGVATVARCGTGNIDLYATASEATKVRWYKSIGTAHIGEVNSTEKFTTAVTEGDALVYSVTAFNPTTTCESIPTNVTVNCNTVPTIITPELVSNCGSPSVELKATSGNGGNRVRWYTETGTSPLQELASGAILVRNITSGSTNIYKATGYSTVTNCESPKKTVTVTADASPTVTTATNVSRCGEGIVELTATANGVDQVRWYNDAGILQETVNSGEKFITGNIITTTTFSVEAYSSTIIGCTSATKTTVTISLDPIPTVTTTKSSESRCGTGVVGLIANATGADKVRWYEFANEPKLAEILSGVTFVTPSIAIGNTRIFRATAYNSTTGCESPMSSISVIAKTLPTVTPAKTSYSRCGNGTLDISATASDGGTQIKWYNISGVQQGPTLNSDDTFTTASVTIGSNVIYQVSAYDTTTTCESIKAAVSVSAKLIPSITTTQTVSICGAGTAELSATVADGADKVRWYDSSLTLKATLSPTTKFTTDLMEVGDTGIYKVSAVTSSTGCESVLKDINITSYIPPTVQSSENVSRCGAGTVSLTATATNADKVTWYDSTITSLGTINSGATYTTTSINISSPKIYYVEAYNTTGGCKSAKQTVTVTANALPAHSITSLVSRCGTGTIDLVARVTSGDKVIWYNNSGTLLAEVDSDQIYNSASISEGSTLIYQIETLNSSTLCRSASKTSVTLTANVIPTVSTTANVSICSGVAKLGATTGSGGDKLKWYDAASQLQSTIASTELFSTMFVNNGSSKIYQVASLNSITGCESQKISVTVVSVSVVPVPTVSVPSPTVSRCGSGTFSLTATAGNSATKVRWYTASDVLINTYNSGATFITDNIIAGNAVTYHIAGYNVSTGCESNRVSIVATAYKIPTVSTQTAISRCGPGTVDLKATATDADQVKWYTAATSGTLLSTQTSATGTYSPNVTAPISYYVSAYSSTSTCVSDARTQVSVSLKSVPTISVVSNYKCGAGKVALTATPSASANVNWYSDASGGLSLFTGNVFNTSDLTETTTYYAESVLNGCSSTRTPVVATIKTVPTVVSTTTGTRCGTGSVTITANPSEGAAIKWYSVPTNGTVIATSTSYSSPATNTATVTYYAEAILDVCKSETRSAVLATIKPVPSITSYESKSLCGSGMLTLKATPSTSATISWYDVSSSGSSFLTGNSFTTLDLTSSQTYYIEASLNGCSSSRIPITATIYTIPTVNAVTKGTRCFAGSVALNATPSEGTIKWFTTSSGGTATFTGNNFNTPTISSTVIYYAEASSNGCISITRTPVEATVVSNIEVTLTQTCPTACAGAVCVLMADHTAGSLVGWYKADNTLISDSSAVALITGAVGTVNNLYVKATLNSCVAQQNTSITSINCN